MHTQTLVLHAHTNTHTHTHTTHAPTHTLTHTHKARHIIIIIARGQIQINSTMCILIQVNRCYGEMFAKEGVIFKYYYYCIIRYYLDFFDPRIQNISAVQKQAFALQHARNIESDILIF